RDDRDHVERRDALGDAEDRPDPGIDGLHHGVRRARRGDEDARGVGAGLPDGVHDGVEDRHTAVEGGLAALARCHPGDHVRAAVEHRGAVERALAAGQPVDDDPARAVDQDAHAAAPPAPFEAATAWAAASSSELAVWNRASRSRTAASAAFVPTIRTTI